MAISLYDLTRPQLEATLVDWDFSPSHTRRLWNYLYRQRVTSLDEMVELPARLRDRLIDTAAIPALSVARTVDSSDGLTKKSALRLADGQTIETVRLEYAGRTTACLSSQVGCAVGCVFCATGQMGFRRNLTTGEIVSQALHAARGSNLRNVVLMGMGEPLLNYEAVLRAVDILCDPGGLAIAWKRITLSTIGVPHAIMRLADEGRSLSLAVSLHAATQEERSALVPFARGWPLEELMAACRYYSQRLSKRIFFEWTLIEGQNDSPDQARALRRLLHDMPAQVNLIPLNVTPGFKATAAQRESIDRFRSILAEGGIACSIRQYRGIDVAAGCGQLAGIGQA